MFQYILEDRNQRKQSFLGPENQKIFLGNKRSQVEIIGIAVVIILLILGLLFYVGFAARRSSSLEEEKSKIDDKQLVNNILNSMLITNTDLECHDMSIRTLIKDCVDYLDIRGSIVCRDGESSCNYLEKVLDDNFIEPVLGPLEKDYNFTITYTKSPNTRIFSESSPDPNACNRRRKEVIASEPFIVSGNVGTAVLELKICYKI